MAQAPNTGWMQQHTSKISDALIGAIVSMGAIPSGTDAKKIADEIAEIVEQTSNDLVREQAEAMANQLSGPAQPQAINNFGTTQGNNNSEDQITTNHLADEVPKANSGEVPAELPGNEAPASATAEAPKPVAQDPGYIPPEPENQPAPDTDIPEEPSEEPAPERQHTSAQQPVGQTGPEEAKNEEQSEPQKERSGLTQRINSIRYGKQIKELEKQNSMDHGQLREAQKPLKELDKKLAKKEKERKRHKLRILPFKIARYIILAFAVLLTLTIIFFFFIPIAPPLFAAAAWINRVIKMYNKKIELLDEEIANIKKQQAPHQKTVDEINKRMQVRTHEIRALQHQSLLQRRAG